VITTTLSLKVDIAGNRSGDEGGTPSPQSAHA
jgi:hypothetical protein